MKTQNNKLTLAAQNEMEDELHPEYDASVLRNGVHGKLLAQYRAGTNLVLLAPDAAAAFPTDQAVNDALMQTQEGV